MVMWLRLGGALLITMAVAAALEYFGVSALVGGRSVDEVQHDAETRLRELFWMMIFAAVMATAVLAALRRCGGRARRALAPALHARRRACSILPAARGGHMARGG
jgi:hypothetical protein